MVRNYQRKSNRGFTPETVAAASKFVDVTLYGVVIQHFYDHKCSKRQPAYTFFYFGVR